MRKMDEEFKKMMKGVSIESPSQDFTLNVMNAIRQQQVAKVYQPAISKKVWIILSVIFMALIGFILIAGQVDTSESSVIDGWLRTMNSKYLKMINISLHSITKALANVHYEFIIVIIASLILWMLDAIILSSVRKKAH